MNLSSEGIWIHEFISKDTDHYMQMSVFWVSLHVLYVLIKHCCAMFAFSRGCDRYEHAKVCIPRIALPVSQMNQVSLWIAIKRAQEREARRTWVRAKGKIETLICPLPPRIHQIRQDPSITETSSILQHIMEAARPVKKTFTLTHTAYDKLITSPALHLICHMSFSRSFRAQKDLACPCWRLPFNSSSKSHMKNDSFLPVSVKDLICSLLLAS